MEVKIDKFKVARLTFVAGFRVIHYITCKCSVADRHRARQALVYKLYVFIGGD